MGLYNCHSLCATVCGEDLIAMCEQAAFEMNSLVLDNGVELYGTHEEGEGGIEYRITRLEPLPKPNCN